LSFLDTPRKIGDVVRYGDSFVLKNQNGQYLSTFYCTMKFVGGGSVIPDSLLSICVDLDLAAYFPTLGCAKQATLSFITQSPDPAAQINHNSHLMLVSREPGLSALNILGAWDDSHDCYYFDEYIHGDLATKEKWIVQKLGNIDQPLRYGDQIYLANLFYKDKKLTRDTRLGQSGWVTTSAGGDSWTLEPILSFAGPRIDGTNVVILNAGQRVVSWDDGYQTCKVGSRVDGTNCVILNDVQRVVSWEDGYQTCRVGSRIDGTNCVILGNDQVVVDWKDGYQTLSS
jgi:hypothetical protein